MWDITGCCGFISLGNGKNVLIHFLSKEIVYVSAGSLVLEKHWFFTCHADNFAFWKINRITTILKLILINEEKMSGE